MDPLKQMDELAALARQEAAPPVEVSAAVLSRLRSAPVEAEVKARWLAWAAGVTAAAAAPALLLGIEVYQLLSDPLLSYLYQLDWALL